MTSQSNRDSSVFASYATGVAFRLDLTKHMIAGLFRAVNGDEMTSGHHGATGLLNRGLLEASDVQPRSWVRTLQVTEAGLKVAELCELAGLGRIDRQEGGAQ